MELALKAYRRKRAIVWDVGKDNVFEYLNLESYTCCENPEGHDVLPV